jgi:hypothetical protein
MDASLVLMAASRRDLFGLMPMRFQTDPILDSEAITRKTDWVGEGLVQRTRMLVLCTCKRSPIFGTDAQRISRPSYTAGVRTMVTATCHTIHMLVPILEKCPNRFRDSPIWNGVVSLPKPIRGVPELVWGLCFCIFHQSRTDRPSHRDFRRSNAMAAHHFSPKI